MSDQGPADEVWIELSESEAAFLEQLSGRPFAGGNLALPALDAHRLVSLVLERIGEHHFNEGGELNADGRALAEFGARLDDDAECRALRARSRAGDIEAAYQLAVRKEGNPFAVVWPGEALRQFRIAYAGGHLEAGHALALMRRSVSGLDLEERIDLLEDAALSGNCAAAMELLYLQERLVEPRRMIPILEAVAAQSTEAREWLVRLRQEEAGEAP